MVRYDEAEEKTMGSIASRGHHFLCILTYVVRAIQKSL